MTGYSKQGRTTRAKVTELEVRRMRREAEAGTSARDLARRFGLSTETVRRILRWETWAWVSEEDDGSQPPAPYAQPSEVELAASLARVLEKAGMAQPQSHIPSPEENLARQYAAGEAQAQAAAEKLAKAYKQSPEGLLEELRTTTSRSNSQGGSHK